MSEYGRCLEGEYVRSRLRVKALGMAEASADAPAGVACESGMSITNIEGRGGFGPFVDEGNDRVATLESLRASLRGLRHMEFDGVASSGCERDSWADASAPSPSWIGTTESGQGGGDQGILGSLRVDEASTLVDTMFIDLIRRVDCDVDSTSSAEAHAHGDPPRIGDTGAYRTERLSKDLSEKQCVERSSGEREEGGRDLGQSRGKKKEVGDAAFVSATEDRLSSSEGTEDCRQGVTDLTFGSLSTRLINEEDKVALTTTKLAGINCTEAQKASVTTCQGLLRDFRQLLAEVTCHTPVAKVTGATVIGEGATVRGGIKDVANPCCEGREELTQHDSAGSLEENFAVLNARCRLEELEAELQRHKVKRLFEAP